MAINSATSRIPWYDKLLIDIAVNPWDYLGWLAVVCLPLIAISLCATMILLKAELQRLGKKTKKAKLK